MVKNTRKTSLGAIVAISLPGPVSPIAVPAFSLYTIVCFFLLLSDNYFFILTSLDGVFSSYQIVTSEGAGGLGMFRKILVPIEFSKANARALEVAVDIATHYEGCVDLLHVIEIIANSSFSEFKDFYLKLEKRAHKYMEKWVALYGGHPVHIEPYIVYGHRVQDILAFSQEHQTDLILLSSHKFNPKNALRAWSAISHKIGIMSRCPVLLVK